MASETIEPAVLAKAASLNVFDSAGKSVSFGSIFAEQKTIVVFIRHFHCGRCQDYAAQLAGVRDDALQNAQTRIVLVGCGQPSLIAKYRDETGYVGEIYADPSVALFKTLELGANLKMTPAGEQRKSYAASSSWSSGLKSAWRGPLTNPLDIGKQGPYAQLGGDFVLGPGEHCVFAHRMQHTADHVETKDLMQAAGVAYP